MSDTPIITTHGDEPTVVRAFECKFTVESSESMGGDLLKNIGGARSEKRVTFEGYASNALIAALIGAIEGVVE